MYYKKQESPKFKKLNNQIKIDWNLYFTLLYKQSPSKTKMEVKFVNWLYEYIKKKCPAAIVERDALGSIYVTKGESDIYPCVVAHTDTAQEYHNNPKVIKNGDWVFAMDLDNGEQIGMGMDDKNGIYVALEMLLKFDKIKAYFPVDEEIGCIGSGACNVSFFDDCSMILQADRRSWSSDVISFTNGVEVCDDKFLFEIFDLMDYYGYSENTGTCTDIGAIKKRGAKCVAINISCGYFDEHMDNERTNIIAFENCINFVHDLIVQEGYTKHEHISFFLPIKNSQIRKKGHIDSDWYQDEKLYTPSIKEDVYHDCEHFDFNTGIDVDGWIEENLEINQCPYCQSTLENGFDGSLLCESCNSEWNIPNNKYQTKLKY